MVHTPKLAIGLVDDLGPTPMPPETPLGEFSLLEFLYTRNEFQKMVDIYQAVYGFHEHRQGPSNTEQDVFEELRRQCQGLLPLILGPQDKYWLSLAFKELGHFNEAAMLLSQALLYDQADTIGQFKISRQSTSG